MIFVSVPFPVLEFCIVLLDAKDSRVLTVGKTESVKALGCF